MRSVAYIVFILLSVSAAVGQTRSIQRIGIEQGLSQSTVMAVVQDSEGFLWIGTWDGLNRYDGYSFVHYHHDPLDTTSLSYNSIASLLVDSRGDLWVGTTAGGLNLYDRVNDRFIRYPSPARPRKSGNMGGVYEIKEDAAGRIWALSSFGLHQYDTERRFVKHVVLPDVRSTTFTQQEVSGGVYFTWMNRLICTTPGGEVYAAELYGNEEEKKNAAAGTEFYIDRSGTSWMFSSLTAVSEYHWGSHSTTPRFRSTNDPSTLSSNTVRMIFEDSENNLWIGTEFGLNKSVRNGIGEITGFERIIYESENTSSISSDEINTIFEDRTGVIWVGTKVGINKILPQRKKFERIPAKKPLKSMFQANFAVALYEESDSLVWIGSVGDLAQYNSRADTWKILNQKNSGISSVGIHVILKDKKGRIWAGTRYGLNRYNAERKRFTPYLFDLTYPSQLYRNRIYAMSEDDDGMIWLGTSSGVIRFDPETGKNERKFFDTVAAGEGNSSVLSLLNEKDTLWVGLNGHGILKMNKKTFEYERFRHDPNDRTTLSNNQPMAIFKDRNGTIWITTLGGGLNKMLRSGAGVSFRTFNSAEGLLNSVLYGIVEAADGNLWVSSNHGISKFDPMKQQFTNYSMQDGLPTQEYNQNSYHLGKSGAIYFGGVNGIVKFRPEEITINTTPPQIAVTDFSVFSEHRNDLLRSGEITLSYLQNFFSFEFTSLCFEMPEKNQYAYRLEGLQNEWNYIGTRRFASFTNIDPGEYLFRVKGSNNDGVWNEQGVSVKITIVPPFWATLWFRLLAVTFFIGVIVGGVRYSAYRKYRRQIEELEQQKRILEERQKTRDKIARDLHDDLASTVGSAGLFIETAKRTMGEDAVQAKEYLDKTSSILTEAEEAMSDIVWSVSPKHDTLQSLATRIRLVTTELCRANGIRSTVDVKGNIEVPLTDEIRRGIYLIFKEGLNNCLKHSKAMKVEVCVGSKRTN
jgi:two-component system sensor histidine kinase ChiS